VATDLRLLVASLRMSSSLERMGDLAAHVALVARRAHPDRAVPARHREQVARMSELGLTALRAAAQVIRTRDLALGAQVEKQDDELDELMLTISREISGSDEDSYTNAEVIDRTLLIGFYERIGDLAVSLVRRVGFLVTGDSPDTFDEGVDVQEFCDADPARVGPPRRSAGRPSCAREHERAGQPRLGRGLRVTSRSVPVCAPRLAAT